MSSTEGRNHPSDSHALVNRSGARRPSIFSRIRRDSLSARDTTIHFEFQGIVDSSMRHGNQVHGVAVDCSAQRCSDSFLDSRPSAGLLTPLEKRQQLTTSLLKPPDRRNELHVSHHAQPPQRSDRPTHSPIMHHRIRQLRGNCSQDVSVLSLPNSPAYTKFSTSMKQSDANNNQSILSEGAICRICHEGDADERLVSPCYCSGSLGMLHLSCLERWLDASNTTKCEICLFQFIVERRPHPVKWYLKNSMLETERKNLYCDAICLSLFAPITIICTTLCLLGARYFSSVGKTEIETCLIIVCVLNLTMFGVWCLIQLTTQNTNIQSNNINQAQNKRRKSVPKEHTRSQSTTTQQHEGRKDKSNKRCKCCGENTTETNLHVQHMEKPVITVEKESLHQAMSLAKSTPRVKMVEDDDSSDDSVYKVHTVGNYSRWKQVVCGHKPAS
ncbi:hypothetical protein ScPMuIL_018230 [Solemya velum]